MIRRNFLKRMAFAALASAFIDLEVLAPAVVTSTELTALTSLIHEVYAGKVIPHVRRTSPMNKLLMDPGPYPIQGEKLVFSTKIP